MEKDRIVISVGAVVEDGKGNILLVRKTPERDRFRDGKWTCPGGKLKVGERIADGIRRAVKEETRLSIDLKTPLRPFESISRSPNGVERHVVYVNYLACRTDGELLPGNGVEKAIWIDRSSISDIWDALHEDTKKLLLPPESLE